jgi:mono/diheme cytochrome c family protein
MGGRTPGGMGMRPGAPAAVPTTAATTVPTTTSSAGTAPSPTATPPSPTPTPAITAASTPAEIYQVDCAVCHGVQRQGGRAPALLPSTLTGDPSYFVSVVEYGAPGTLMPGWLGQGLTAAQIRALVDYLRTTP